MPLLDGLDPDRTRLLLVLLFFPFAAATGGLCRRGGDVGPGAKLVDTRLCVRAVVCSFTLVETRLLTHGGMHAHTPTRDLL